jgi:cytochrome c
MDHVNVNRVSLSALGAVLFVMLLVAFSNLVLSPGTPKVPGFALPSGEPAAATASTPAAPEVPLPTLLAKADVTKGEHDVKVCETCHNFKEGAGAKIGPDLYDVVGRPVGSVAGFAYSDALKKIGGDWTFEKLDAWIADPKTMAPGTKMAFAGEKDAQKRADILDYLHTLSGKPVPLPTK